jgi:hypothetical protein
MQPRIPEKNKKAGVCYAVTDDGLELPVIDVTQPAFAIRLSDRELDELLQKHLKEVKSQERTPAFLMRLILGFMQRRSFLMRGLAASAGTFMSGMHTYLMKLGPDNLNDGYATNIDRRIAASLPVVSIRLRLQDLAHLLADGLTPALGADGKAALHLLNIGGGSAIDSLNVLIVLHKEHPGLLAGRRIFIHILDLEEAGPSFSARALTSLLAENGPLHGLEVGFDHVKYDWSDPTVLRELVSSFDGQGVVVAASTEGALFEYGSDEEIVANLRTLLEAAPAEAVVAGTVTRADDIGRLLNGSSRAAINLRGLEAFKELALRAGWKITKDIDRPMSHDILLEKA